MLAQERRTLVALLSAAVRAIVPDVPLPEVLLERPKDPSHGDIASTVALQLAKPARRNPRELGEAIAATLLADPAARALVEGADVAGPGFINIRFTAAARLAVVRTVLVEKERFGFSDAGAGERVLIEFVSANPTGPLHVGHGRQGALGDALAAVLATQGWEVVREFYYNDSGAQIENLTRSVQARLKGLAPGLPGWPENAYNGDYVLDVARAYAARATVSADDRSFTASGDPDDLDSIRQFSVAYLRHEQDLDLRAFGVRFDNYFLESSLYARGKVDEVVDRLNESGQTYEKDGALWLRTSAYGDDEDRAMRKQDGSFTYFVPDIAYHLDKWRRGFHRDINIMGSDHQSEVQRVRIGLQCLGEGIAPGYPDAILHKMVKVMKGGAEVKISKREGSYVTLRDLIEWAGRDAVRFFLVSRKAETEFVFDVDLARSQSEENPVYYVQYAHARIASVFAQWRERDPTELDLATVDLSPLSSDHELALLRRLSAYPDMLAQAAADRAPHQVAFYLKDCAADLHSYYNAERVLVDDLGTRHARLALLAATQQVLKNGLTLLGVSAPDKM